MFKLATKPKTMRDDIIVFFLSHMEDVTDVSGNRKSKAKTLGKMIDDKISYEGLFSIVLFTYKKETRQGIEYGFTTNGDPASTAKSPRGMFESTEIPNNLMLVAEKIREYED